jgi:hypothetical protein
MATTAKEDERKFILQCIEKYIILYRLCGMSRAMITATE